MKIRQVKFVLIALISVGLIGMVIRIASSSSSDLVLSGLLPVSPEVITKVTLESSESKAELIRTGDDKTGYTWRVGAYEAFEYKASRFWEIVDQINGAQLIATNPNNHEIMGVDENQGITLSFYLGPSIQEQFILTEEPPGIRLCYLRRSGNDDVYGIPCPYAKLFDPDPDGWRDPIITAIPSSEIDYLIFKYPEEEFILRLVGGLWTVSQDDTEYPADPYQISNILNSVEFLVASGFAKEDISRNLKFDPNDVSIRIVTKQESSVPTTRLRFLKRDDTSYYVSTYTSPTVYILDNTVTENLIKTSQDLLTGTNQ